MRFDFERCMNGRKGFSQVADLDVYDFGTRVKIISPNLHQYGLAIHHLFPAPNQKRQEPAWRWLQLKLAIMKMHHVLLNV